MTADRAASEEYPLTQEMLAQMLGVSRQFLSEVAHAFKAAGLID
jgi:DNA-binding IscR family transcriptional regulator